jgi:hypothetical protein
VGAVPAAEAFPNFACIADRGHRRILLWAVKEAAQCMARLKRAGGEENMGHRASQCAGCILIYALAMSITACSAHAPEHTPAAQKNAADKLRSECVRYHAHRYPKLAYPDPQHLCESVYQAVRAGSPPPSWVY